MASLGIGVDDEVLVPALSWIATAEAVNNVGAEPVFVDIDKRTFKLNVEQIADILKKENPDDYAGILPVHLIGYPNDMDEINTVA